jgi:hypothetical protein
MRFIFAGCCARATSGNATAPPTSAMNSRRLIRSPHRSVPAIGAILVVNVAKLPEPLRKA